MKRVVCAPLRVGLPANARALLGWWTVAVVAVAGLLWSGGATARAQADAAAEELQQGAELYAANCAACHGPRGGGGPGEMGLTAGPAIAGIEVAYVDQQLRTGRMPLVDRVAGVVRPTELTDEEREAVLAWMVEELELSGEIPQVGEGDRSRGQELYTVHCAACHGSVGNGGIVGRGVTALSLRGIDRVAMVEALRVGPYDMPAFGEELISAQGADDIAAFTGAAFEDPEITVLGLGEQNRVGLAGMVLVLVVVILGGTVLVARKVRMPTEGDEG